MVIYLLLIILFFIKKINFNHKNIIIIFLSLLMVVLNILGLMNIADFIYITGLNSKSEAYDILLILGFNLALLTASCLSLYLKSEVSASWPIYLVPILCVLASAHFSFIVFITTYIINLNYNFKKDNFRSLKISNFLIEITLLMILLIEILNPSLIVFGKKYLFAAAFFYMFLRKVIELISYPRQHMAFEVIVLLMLFEQILVPNTPFFLLINLLILLMTFVFTQKMMEKIILPIRLTHSFDAIKTFYKKWHIGLKALMGEQKKIILASLVVGFEPLHVKKLKREMTRIEYKHGLQLMIVLVMCLTFYFGVRLQ